jgi:hypothetical protein
LRAKLPSSPGWGAVSAEQLPFAWPEEGADIIGVDVLADIESIPYSMATPEDLPETAALIERPDAKRFSHCVVTVTVGGMRCSTCSAGC